MTDIELARKSLEGHTLALCRGGNVVTSDKRGVAPMVDFIREGRDLTGYSAADRVVGKAAAVLFIKAGVKEIHALTLSESARDLLAAHGVKATWETLTDRIMNRAGDGPCPMESAVSGTDDTAEAFGLIAAKLDAMRGANK